MKELVRIKTLSTNPYFIFIAILFACYCGYHIGQWIKTQWV